MFGNGSPSPWMITEMEQQQNDVQFATLNPVNGLVSGDQAKPLFMKSGLPPAVLAQVWQLADYTKDGKVDRHEFSVAMHLIRTVMAGVPLPSSLPNSLKPPTLATQSSLGGLASVTGLMNVSGSSVPAMGISGMPSTGMRPMMSVPIGMPGSVPAGMTSSIRAGMPGSLAVGMSGPTSGIPGVIPTGTIRTPPLLQPAPPPGGGAPMAAGMGRVQEDWTIAHHNKLKYCQQFNQLDKGRVGTLSGVHARNVLAQSQLPNVTLAEIWSLSDVNKDGRLSVEEFCIAMHLIDSVKAGFLLPKKLPAELLAMCVRSKNESPVLDANAPPAQKAPPPRTFEDKRRDNYDRGQAELDRRRQILREEEERRRAEQEKKEREEAERREREREEAEKRRRAEREAELEREREREAARQAEERRILAEKEEARREMERQRKADLDAIRIRDIKAQHQAEIDNTAQRQQRKKTLSFQLQALDEKSTELNTTITKARDRIVQITSQIETMKSQRDNKMAIIRTNEANNNNASVQCERLAHESLQLQAESQSLISRNQKIEEVQASLEAISKGNSSMQEQLQSVDNRTQLQKQLVSKKASELEECRMRLAQLVTANETLRVQLISAQQNAAAKMQQLRMQQQTAATTAVQKVASPTEPTINQVAYNGAEKAQQQQQQQHTSPACAIGGSLPQATGATTGAVKYRALYEFNARTEDELSFQPGDIILVFEGHAAEPGWLAGQMRDKVGWFPLAFAEPVASVGPVTAQPPQTVSAVICSPSSEPLQSITEEPPLITSKANEFEQPTSDHPVGDIAVETAAKESAAQPETVIGLAVAQYQWKARNETELNFSKGDTIEILEQLEMRWKGRSQSGAIGWFPKSYVKMREDSARTQAEATSSTTPVSTQQSLTKGSQGTPAETPSSPPAAAPSSIPIYDIVSGEPPETTGAAADHGEWYIALYDFKASEPTDLELKAGDRILVTETSDDWWRGTCEGRSGIFPANYVQKCPNTDALAPREGTILGIGRVLASFEATAENQLSLHVGETVTIRSKSPAGWWQGEIVSGDGVKRAGWFPGNYVEMVQQESEVIAEALYDYAAQRNDELSFKNGDLIVVTERSDAEWWKGRLQKISGGPEALFPANYVRLSVVACSRKQPSEGAALASGHAEGRMSAKLDIASQDTASRLCSQDTANAKLTNITEELLVTEVRFHRDLSMCREVFAEVITPVIGASMAKRLFLNVDQLVTGSAQIASALRANPGSPGKVFVERMNILHAFVEFCSNQQSALELLNELELNNLAFQQVYRRCCENTRARGLNMSYLLLLPMGRITRYPLLFEKLIKYTPKESPHREDLEKAYQMLKSLCAEVNTVICEMDNTNMLLWAQHHIRCEGIKPAILFPSQTRKVGPRSFLHSGIFQKQRSGKVLVALLFSDFLMLTTPIEPIEEVEGFKITKNSDLQLQLYKNPLLLGDLSVQQPKEKEADECALLLKYGTTIIPVRATSRNARVLWSSQLEKAIEKYRKQAAPTKKSSALSLDSSAKGRLLVELICLRNISVEPSTSGTRPIVCQFQLGNEMVTAEVDLNQGENLFTTQLPILSNNVPFRVLIFLPRLYSLDVCAGVGEIAMSELATAAAAHRGPILRQIHLSGAEIPCSQCFVIVKFVVQMFY